MSSLRNLIRYHGYINESFERLFLLIVDLNHFALGFLSKVDELCEFVVGIRTVVSPVGLFAVDRCK